MKNFSYKRIAKLLGLIIGIWLAVLFVDYLFFYEDHFYHTHNLLMAFLSPLQLVFSGFTQLFEVITAGKFNVLDSSLYKMILVPRGYPVSLYITTLVWSAVIVLAYSLIPMKFKEKGFSILRYLLIVFIFILLLHLLSLNMFGDAYTRFCPGCA